MSAGGPLRARRTGARAFALVLIGWATVAAVLAGCGRGAGPTAAAGHTPPGRSTTSSVAPSVGPTGTLTVLAAASLTESFTAIGRAFQAAHPGVRVRFSFGASSTLAQQVVAGAPADVFAAASTTAMSTVVAAGDAEGPAVFAHNRAEIAVAPQSGARIRTVGDLARPGVRVALCAVQVPCGALARTVLSRAHVTLRPTTEGLDVKAVLATVASGEVDAGIVYVTDVRAAGARVRGVPVPAADNATTTYPLAVVRGSPHAVLAREFTAYVRAPAGQRALRAAGFTGP